MDGTKPAEKPRSAQRGARIVLAVALLALVLFGLSRGRPVGDVFFTGLDDSAQTALAHSLEAGAPLLYRDEAFAAVPPEVRPDLLYRPGLPRKTRDLAHQLDPATCEARPFFQPFLPWQRAHLPQLPFALAVLAFFVPAVLSGFSAGWPRPNLGALVQTILLAVSAVFLVPWIPFFAFGPYAEGPATLLAACALVWSFASGGTHPWTGAVPGVLLGLAATFHPTLALYAVPIGLFAVMRAGRWRHTLALALGAAAGLAPLVLSTLFVCAPYGTFLHPAALRRMIGQSADVRALAVALALAVPSGLLLVALAHAPRLRAAAAHPRVRAAVAAAAGAAILFTAAAAWLHPAAHRALLRDADGIVRALPAIAAAVAMALWSRRPSTCALLAGCALAALPFFVIQGQEVHVGLWSLRRSLPPFALFPLAACVGAFEISPEEEASGAVFVRRAWTRRGWVLLCFACAVAQGIRIPPVGLAGGEAGADAIVRQVSSRLQPDGLYLFDRFPDASPFASRPGLAVFGLNGHAANTLAHDRVVRWLGDECAKRPVRVVSPCRDLREEPAPSRPSTVLESGIALESDEAAAVRGRTRRLVGKTFGTSVVEERPLAFRFFRVRPAERGDSTEILFTHSPFGLSGAWDASRHGKDGRWARVGSGFWGPVPEPGGAVELEFETAWTPPPGTDWPVQKLLVIPPWKAEPAVLDVRADAGRHVLRATVTRPAGDTADIPPSALWRFSTTRVYDPAAYGIKGYPPDLAVPVYRLRAAPVP